MSKVLSILVLPLLILLIVGLPFWCFFLKFFVPMHQDDMDGVSATGVFKPGGYIRLEVATDVESLLGLYQGLATIEPALEETQKQKGIIWPTQRKAIGREWGNTIYTRMNQGTEKIKFDVSLTIPAASSLSGEKIPLLVTADLKYPRFAGYPNFVTDSTRIGQRRTEILIQGGQLFPWESIVIWSQEGGREQILLCIASVLWVFTLVGFLDIIDRYRRQFLTSTSSH